MGRRVYTLVSAICLMSIVLWGWAGFSQPPQPSVQLKTSPSISQIRPLEAEATQALGSGSYKPPMQLDLQAIDAQGQALKDAKIHLQIFTPPKNPWFTTDFPIVEGTKLLDIEANAPTGRLEIQQTLPIRGTYQLLVNVMPIAPEAFIPIQQTLTLSVTENEAKYLNFGILALTLLAAGSGGGWLIGSRQTIQPGEIAPQNVRLLLSGAILMAIAALLYVNISAELAQSDISMAMSHPTEDAPKPNKPASLQSQGLEMHLSGDSSVTVGQPAKFQASIVDAKTRQPVTDVTLKLTTTQLENDWVAFAYQGTPDSAGKLIWQQGFFDGAPHSIEVEVAPQANSARQFQPFQVAQDIPVEGVAPPLFVRLISLAYMTGIMVVGLLIGLWLQRRRIQRSNPTWKRGFLN